MELRLRLAPENSVAQKDSDPSPQVLQNQLADLETQFALVRDRAGLSRSHAGQAIATQPVALAALQAKLRAIDKAALIVEFAALPDGLSAFLIGPSYFEQIVWKTDMQALAQDVRTLRGLLSDRDSGDDLPPVVGRVAEAVWKPLAAKLPAGTQHILIAPASFLNYIPFQVLPASTGKQLIDQFTISYLPSASTLALLGPPGAAGGNVFLGALGSLAVAGMPPLEATIGEVDGIRRLYPKATVAKEMDLTHDTVLAALQERDLVHLATHGIYEPAAPLFSALLMSPAKNQASRLSLYELTDVQVKAKLVVLSACDSGIGKLMEGDEIAGLTRTFLSAGARTVVSSLWTVDDASTALLMQEFYRQLGKGFSPAAALRFGALAVRKPYVLGTVRADGPALILRLGFGNGHARRAQAVAHIEVFFRQLAMVLDEIVNLMHGQPDQVRHKTQERSPGIEPNPIAEERVDWSSKNRDHEPPTLRNEISGQQKYETLNGKPAVQ
jgi:CHAT domain-containing protein